MEIEIGGDYLNAESCKEGDIVTIAGEGVKSQIKTHEGKLKDVYNFPVVIGDRQLIYTPGMAALKELVKAYSSNSKEWIGKKFQVKIVTMLIRGQEVLVVKPKPLDIKA